MSDLDNREDLRRRWGALTAQIGIPDRAAEVGALLLAAYAEPHRHYHTLGHVAWLLNEEERRGDLIEDRTLVAFAIWFHDAIYDPLAKDNEERSAAWARHVLTNLGLPSLAQPVSRLVLKTKDHSKGEASPDEALFLDMDIAILGAPRTDYVKYSADIRAEYAAVPDEAFAAGRGALLRSWLARKRLFRTDVYHEDLDQTARANMRWELGSMGIGE